MTTPDPLREYHAACDELDHMTDLFRRKQIKSTADWHRYQNAIVRRGVALNELYPLKKAA